MSKLLLAIVHAVLVSCLVVSSGGAAGTKMPETRMFAPELFGQSSVMPITADEIHYLGVIKNGWVTFRFQGVRGGPTGQRLLGVLWQTAGPRIMDRSCPTCAEYPAGRIKFVAWLGTSEFQGKIYFRGEWRKFCGGAGYIPKKCMLKAPKPE